MSVEMLLLYLVVVKYDKCVQYGNNFANWNLTTTKHDNDCESSLKSRKHYANVVAVVIKFCALNSRLFSLH